MVLKGQFYLCLTMTYAVILRMLFCYCQVCSSTVLRGNWSVGFLTKDICQERYIAIAFERYRYYCSMKRFFPGSISAKFNPTLQSTFSTGNCRGIRQNTNHLLLLHFQKQASLSEIWIFLVIR